MEDYDWSQLMLLLMPLLLLLLPLLLLMLLLVLAGVFNELAKVRQIRSFGISINEPTQAAAAQFISLVQSNSSTN